MKKITILTVLLLYNVLSFGQQIKYVNTETLNIRESPGKEYNVVGKIHKGDKIITISESNDWSEIETENGTKGFVATKYLISDKQNEHRYTKKKDNFWIGFLISLAILGYVGYKVKNFFSGLFGGGSRSSSSFRSQARAETSRQSSTSSYKPKPLYWFLCRNCATKITKDTVPSSIGCPSAKSHNWKQLAEIGDINYCCKNCGTTIQTKSFPSSLGCPSSASHNWKKL